MYDTITKKLEIEISGKTTVGWWIWIKHTASFEENGFSMLYSISGPL